MKRQTWRYEITRLYHHDREHVHCEEHMAKMGGYGWELVAVVPYPSDGVTIMHWKQTDENYYNFDQ